MIFFLDSEVSSCRSLLQKHCVGCVFVFAQSATSLLQGYVPMYVNATAGTTVYGAFDPIGDIADICEKYNMWLHVDVRQSKRKSLFPFRHVRRPRWFLTVPPSCAGRVGRRSADVQEAPSQAEWDRKVSDCKNK